jgi:hypothetical protein
MKILTKEDLVKFINNALTLDKNITKLYIHPYSYSKIFDNPESFFRQPKDAMINGLKIEFDFTQPYDYIYFR